MGISGEIANRRFLTVRPVERIGRYIGVSVNGIGIPSVSSGWWIEERASASTTGGYISGLEKRRARSPELDPGSISVSRVAQDTRLVHRYGFLAPSSTNNGGTSRRERRSAADSRWPKNVF